MLSKKNHEPKARFKAAGSWNRPSGGFEAALSCHGLPPRCLGRGRARRVLAFLGRAWARGWRGGGISLFPKASWLAKGAKRWEGKGSSVERGWGGHNVSPPPRGGPWVLATARGKEREAFREVGGP